MATTEPGTPAAGETPELSVIIACFNGAETLEETLASLVVQEWDRPWEILFADNGSTDASAALFAAGARAHPGVRMRAVDAGAEKGKSYALNLGIRMAAGRALLFCDADDTVAPGWLAAMGAALDRHPFVAARIDLALHELSTGHQDSALARLDHVLAAVPDEPRACFYRAVLGVLRGDAPATSATLESIATGDGPFAGRARQFLAEREAARG